MKKVGFLVGMLGLALLGSVQAWASGTLTLTTLPAESITGNNAVLKGTLNYSGSGSSLNLNIYYSTDSTTLASNGPGTMMYGDATPGTDGTTITRTNSVGGPNVLMACTTYYYRLSAYFRSSYVGSGSILSFTTLGCPIAPTVSTAAATVISQTGATLNGNLTAIGSPVPDSVWFQWGTTIAYGSTTSSVPQSAVLPFSAALTTFTCGTTYHYRAVASNSAGTVYGGDTTFGTASCGITVSARSFSAASATAITLTTASLPTVTTVGASALSSTVETLTGTLNTTGGATTTAYFQYGTTTSYGLTASLAPAPTFTTGTVSYTANTATLTCNTTYHYRAVASNSVGLAYGSDLTFTTAACPTLLFSVSTGSISSPTSSNPNVILGGNVVGFGGATTVAGSFQYGRTTSYGSGVSSGSATPLAPNFSTTLSIVSFPSSTTYHVRAVATNAVGTTVYGNDVTFTTPAIMYPAIATVAASPITKTTATLNGKLIILGSGGGVTTTKFWYGLAGRPYDIISGNTGAVTIVNGTFNLPIGGLTCNTDYHYKAQGTSALGTFDGTDRPFRTSACTP